MSKHYFIGIDGGASKCHVRLEDADGRLLADATGGPANIRLSVPQAWGSINHCVNKVLSDCSLSFSEKNHYFHVGMGLAGCEIPDAMQTFLSEPHPFQTLVVQSDAYIACLGAHNGQNGAIIIMGTGTVGYQLEGGKPAKVGGWGFPHDDAGGGAWLGLEAIKLTLQWLDGRAADSGLVKAVFQHFANQQEQLVVWANQANSTAFATIAPLVVQSAQSGDQAALLLMKSAAKSIDAIAAALVQAQSHPAKPFPCVLIGGLAPFLEPYLEQSLRQRLRAALASPAAGAILLARQHIKEYA